MPRSVSLALVTLIAGVAIGSVALASASSTAVPRTMTLVSVDTGRRPLRRCRHEGREHRRHGRLHRAPPRPAQRKQGRRPQRDPLHHGQPQRRALPRDAVPPRRTHRGRRHRPLHHQDVPGPDRRRHRLVCRRGRRARDHVAQRHARPLRHPTGGVAVGGRARPGPVPTHTRGRERSSVRRAPVRARRAT